MRKPVPSERWPESWSVSYRYDREEVFEESVDRGYRLAYRSRRCITLDLLTEGLAPGAEVLDVAAGQGNFSIALAEAGFRVTWNDLREELVGYVQLKHESGVLEFAPGSVFDLAGQGQFDAVLATEVIEHVAHPDELLAKLKELVKPGGVVVISTPNGAFVRNSLPKFSECKNPQLFESVQFRPNADGHIFLLYPEELDALAGKAGLQVEAKVFFNSPLVTGFLGLAPLVRRLPDAAVTLGENLIGRFPRGLRLRLLTHMAARLRRPPVAG